MTSSTSQLVTSPQFEIRFDAATPRLRQTQNHCVLELPSPLLGGSNIEAYELENGVPRWHGEQLLFLENERQIFGASLLKCSHTFQQDIAKLYQNILQYTRSKKLSLHRIWNFVPQINSCESGLEKYREFNLGRWQAFEHNFGAQAFLHMPAASAIGVNDNHFIIFFIAGKETPLYLENPNQVPAYRYPEDYGPKPPGFARATVVHYPKETWGYVSGTASISGHKTIGQGNWRQQFETTMNNIQTMLEKMKISTQFAKFETPSASSLDFPQATLRDWRCYLRHPEMYPLVRDWLTSEYEFPANRITFQLAEICRQDLDLEFEATFVLPNSVKA